MIRLATMDDVPRLVEMGVEFMCSVPPYSAWTPKPEVLETTARAMIQSEAQDVFVADMSGGVVGMLGVATYRHPLTGELTATEMFWWVSPAWRGRTGLALLRAAERWAASHGAGRLQMIAPNPDVARIYEQRGYEALSEITYHKAIVIPECNDYTTQELTV